jgi:hypothetical protein
MNYLTCLLFVLFVFRVYSLYFPLLFVFVCSCVPVVGHQAVYSARHSTIIIIIINSIIGL